LHRPHWKYYNGALCHASSGKYKRIFNDTSVPLLEKEPFREKFYRGSLFGA
jgi:hypothetical protein